MKKDHFTQTGRLIQYISVYINFPSLEILLVILSPGKDISIKKTMKEGTKSPQATFSSYCGSCNNWQCQLHKSIIGNKENSIILGKKSNIAE